MGGMELFRGRNVDHIHIGTGAQSLGTLIRLGIKFATEFLQLAWVDIGRGSECNVRMPHESRDHVAGSPTQPHDAQAQGHCVRSMPCNAAHGSPPMSLL